jgi:Na+-transporting NADH:ubiquinone oxidoreductase subunit A
MFNHFDEVKFRLLVSSGNFVKIGQPLAEDKEVPGRFFVAPAAGQIREILRGEKRKLLAIVIQVTLPEEELPVTPKDIKSISKEELIQFLLTTGCFAYIRARPFQRLAHPAKLPKSIFVKALESAPFAPSAELQLLGHEEDFQWGLQALTKIAPNCVHLVFREGSLCKAFTEASGVCTHTVAGPHPSDSLSLHIQKIDPIVNVHDIIWTVHAVEVVAMGYLLRTGRILKERVISLAGEGIKPAARQLYRVRLGHAVEELVEKRLMEGSQRLILGNVLTGDKVTPQDFLGIYHNALAAIPEMGPEREFLHFFRLGKDKYTASGAYLSGHMDTRQHSWSFSTSQHGEERFFIDSAPYEKVMPLNVPPMQLLKAIMAEDYERAVQLGLLEIVPEDFALPEFVCPSKIEMMQLIKEALRYYAKEIAE